MCLVQKGRYVDRITTQHNAEASKNPKQVCSYLSSVPTDLNVRAGGATAGYGPTVTETVRHARRRASRVSRWYEAESGWSLRTLNNHQGGSGLRTTRVAPDFAHHEHIGVLKHTWPVQTRPR